jgi:PKD repeat protein
MGNFELRAGSPLIDAGTPGGLAAGEPKTDVVGDPRILAGNGTCKARRDIGAYEYAPSKLPAQATANPSKTRVGRSISFHATGCSVDPSLHVTFKWHFDNGTNGTGAVVRHAFKRAGKHRATVTVSDTAGRRGRVTVTVTVSPRHS